MQNDGTISLKAVYANGFSGTPVESTNNAQQVSNSNTSNSLSSSDGTIPLKDVYANGFSGTPVTSSTINTQVNLNPSTTPPASNNLTGWAHKLGQGIAGFEQGAALRFLPPELKAAYLAGQFGMGAANGQDGSRIASGIQAVGNPQDTMTNLASHLLLNKDIGPTNGLGDLAASTGGMMAATGLPIGALKAAPLLAAENPSLLKQAVAPVRQLAGNMLQQAPTYAASMTLGSLGSNYAINKAQQDIPDSDPNKADKVALAGLGAGLLTGAGAGIATQRWLAPVAGRISNLTDANNALMGAPSQAKTNLAQVQEATLGGANQPDGGVAANKVLADDPSTQVQTQTEPVKVNNSDGISDNLATAEFSKLLETPTAGATSSEEEATLPLKMATNAQQVSSNIKDINDDLYDTVNTALKGKTIPVSRQAVQDLMNQSAIQSHPDMPLTEDELNDSLDKAANFADKNPSQSFANVPDLKGSIGFIKDKLNSILGLSNPAIEGADTEVSNPIINISNEDHGKLLNLLNSVGNSLNLTDAPSHVQNFVKQLPAILRQAKTTELNTNPEYVAQGLGPIQAMADKMYAVRKNSEAVNPTLSSFANVSENPKNAAIAEQSFLNDSTNGGDNPLAHLDYHNQVAQQAAQFSKNPAAVNQTVQKNNTLLGQIGSATRNQATKNNNLNNYEQSLIRTKAQLEGNQPPNGAIAQINKEQKAAITPIETPYKGVKSSLGSFINKGKFDSDAFASQLMSNTGTTNDAIDGTKDIYNSGDNNTINKLHGMIMEKAQNEFNNGTIEPAKNQTQIENLANLHTNLNKIDPNHPLLGPIQSLLDKSVDNNISSFYKPGKYQDIGSYINQVKNGITHTKTLANQLGLQKITDKLSSPVKKELEDSQQFGTTIKDGLNNKSLKSMSQMLDDYTKKYKGAANNPTLATAAANRMTGLQNIMNAREQVAQMTNGLTRQNKLTNVLDPGSLITHWLGHGFFSMAKTILNGYHEGNKSGEAIKGWLGNLPEQLNSAQGRANLMEELRTAKQLNQYTANRKQTLNKLGPIGGAYLGATANNN